MDRSINGGGRRDGGVTRRCCSVVGRVALVVAVDILAGGECCLFLVFFLPPFGNLGGETFVFDVISCPHSQFSLPSAFANNGSVTAQSQTRLETLVGRIS